MGRQATYGAMSFKGRPVTPALGDTMEDTEIEELYARYETRLGAAMSKCLGSFLLRLYASAASMLQPLPPSRQPELVADLEQDPFVSSTLKSTYCELYDRYGMYLAPLTTVLTTAKHCEWGCPSTIEDTVEADNHTSAGNDDGCGHDERRTGNVEGCAEQPKALKDPKSKTPAVKALRSRGTKGKGGHFPRKEQRTYSGSHSGSGNAPR